MSKRTLLLFSISVAILAGAAAAMLFAPRETIVLRAGTALDAPRPIAEFALLDQSGRRFDHAALAGRWSLVFTGFTHCPDICPTTLSMLSSLSSRLASERLQMVFVTVDPERDTPDRLAVYLAHFGPDLVGATGSRDQIEAFTHGLGLAQVKNPGTGAEYTVDHSAALVLLDPRVRLVGYFQAPHDLDAIAADLAALPPG